MRPTNALLSRHMRLPLTTKTGPRNYYKGTRSGSMGRHTKHAGYIVDFDKVRHYVCPDLKEFKLTPFVTNRVRPMRGSYGSRENLPSSGSAYLERWKRENAED